MVSRAAFVAGDCGVPEGFAPADQIVAVSTFTTRMSRWSQGCPANNGCGPPMSKGSETTKLSIAVISMQTLRKEQGSDTVAACFKFCNHFGKKSPRQN